MKENQPRSDVSAKESQNTHLPPKLFKKKPRTFIVIIAILGLSLIISLGIVGYLAYQGNLLRKQISQELASRPTTTSTLTPTMSAELIAPMEWKTFTSKLGFSFDYPAEWGEVIEEIIDNEKLQNGYTGKSYSLTFSQVKDSYLDYARGNSADYSAARGAVDSDYIGDSDKPAQVISWIRLNWKQTVENSSQRYSFYPDFGIIDFNLPEREISGVRFFKSLLSEKGIEKFIDEYHKKYPEPPSSSCLNYGNCEQEVSKTKEILGQMRKEKTLDEESLMNLAIYDRMVESSKIIP